MDAEDKPWRPGVWRDVLLLVTGLQGALTHGHSLVWRILGAVLVVAGLGYLTQRLVRRLRPPRPAPMPPAVMLTPGDEGEWIVSPGDDGVRLELRTADRRFRGEFSEAELPIVEAVMTAAREKGHPTDLNALLAAKLGRRPFTRG